MAQYTPLFYRGAPASIPQVVAHLQKAMTEEDPDYTPLRQRMPPASIPDIVAHIQKYLTENAFVTMEDLGNSIAQYIEDHPEIVGVASINGSTGDVTLDAGDIPVETGEDPTIAGAISYLSSQIAILVADAVMSINNVLPDDSHNVTLTGADIAQDANTTKKLSETFGAATSSTAGTKGLVPAPAAGDENKVLSGSGTWVNQSTGTVQQVCGVSPNAQGNVPLKGSDIPLQSMSLQTVAQAITAAATVFTGATSSAAGAKGQVPAPAAGDENKVLSGAGTWVAQSSGSVQTVNSVSPDSQGNVSLTGSSVPTSSTDSTPIATTLSSLNDQIGNLQDGLATPAVTGSTNNTGSTITKGTYFQLNNVLCVAIANIADDATFTANTNYRVVSEGGLNALRSVIDFTSSVTVTENATLRNIQASKCGRIAIVSFLVDILSTSTTWTSILNIPNEIEPYADYYSIIMNDTNFSSMEARVAYGHVDIWRPVVGNTYLGTITYITNN